MAWQDTVISACTIVLVLGVFPSIFGKDKPALATCLITTAAIALMALMFYSLELWFTAIANTANTAVWTTLMIQQLRRRGSTA